MFRRLIFTAFILLSTSLFAAKIYVATDGDDTSGNGGIGSPYATVQKAADVAQPGDSVFVREGIYYEGVVLKTSGEADNRIVFSNYPGETPILDGSALLTGWTKCVSAADCADNPNWAHIWYADLPGDVDAAGVGIYESGEPLKQAMYPNQPDPFYNDQAEYFKLIPTEGYTETTIVDSEVFTQTDPGYWTGTKIWIWGGNNNVIEQIITGYSPAEHKITFTEMGFPAGMKEDRYALVNHLFALDTLGEYVVDTATSKIYLWPRYTSDPNDGSVYRGMDVNGFKINGKSYVTIQGFSIRNYEDFSLTYTRDGNGIVNYSTMFSTGLELRNNRITSIQGTGISLGGCKHCIVERNYVGSVYQKGIFNNAAESTIVRENEVYRSSSTAIGFYRSHEVQVLHNYVHECNGHHGNGLTFYLGCHNMLVFGNRVIRGNIALTIGESEGIYVINNILYNPDSYKQGIAVWSRGLVPNPPYPPDSTIDSLIFINNMVYGNIGVGATIKHAVTRNNIVGGYCQNDSATLDQAYNLVFEESWCQPTGEIGTILQSDVSLIFNDFWRDDFTPVATSPAIDAATDVSEFWPTGIFPDFNYSQDILGTGRPQGGAWDIGPYEYTTNKVTEKKLPVARIYVIPNPLTMRELKGSDIGDTWQIIMSSGKETSVSMVHDGGIMIFRNKKTKEIRKILIID